MILKNPIIPGSNADPSICRVGNDYYIATSSFAYFPGVPIYHSKDLVNWELINYALNNSDELQLDGCGGGAGVWAPTLRYHKGTFYMITTNTAVGHFYVKTNDINGAWSSPIKIEGHGHDPDIFFDDDDKCYVLRHDGPNGVSGSAMDIETGKLIGEITPVWRGFEDIYNEAPHIYKINGWYYLLAAEGGTYQAHMITIARSKHPLGPYEGCPNNPILTHRHVVYSPIKQLGHGDIIEAHDGSWWMVFLAVRKVGCHHTLGRETFIVPIKWDNDGWPFVPYDAIFEEIEVDHLLPSVPVAKPASSDNFDGDKLALYWNFVHNPVTANYSLDKGKLILKSGQENLDTAQKQTLLLRRQEQFNLNIEAKLDSLDGNGEAGIVIWQCENEYFSIGLGSNGEIVATKKFFDMKSTTTIPVPKTSNIVFYVDADKDFYRGGIIVDGEKIEISSMSTRLLSLELKFAYDGVFVGMYCIGTSSQASFDSFSYISSK